MPISIVEGLGGILQIVKLAQLMRDIWKHQGHRFANGLFSIRDHPFDWHRKLFELVFDLGEQGREVCLRTTKQWASQQDFLGEAVAYHPEHFVAHIWLQPIQGQDHVALLL